MTRSLAGTCTRICRSENFRIHRATIFRERACCWDCTRTRPARIRLTGSCRPAMRVRDVARGHLQVLAPPGIGRLDRGALEVLIPAVDEDQFGMQRDRALPLVAVHLTVVARMHHRSRPA